jgi:cell division protein FtsB
MVIRRKLRSVLTTLGLYVGAVLFIGYFGVNAYTGNHGLRAKQDLDQQYTALSEELDRLKRERSEWQRRVTLLRSESIDPDMLDERARAVLGYLDRRELTLITKRP